MPRYQTSLFLVQHQPITPDFPPPVPIPPPPRPPPMPNRRSATDARPLHLLREAVRQPLQEQHREEDVVRVVALGVSGSRVSPRDAVSSSGDRGTSSTAASCARSTPAPSGSCAGRGGRGRSYSSGNDGRCGPSRWPRGSPLACATTPRTAPPTTTARGQTSSSKTTKTSGREPFSARGAGTDSACRVEVPLWISYKRLLRRQGALGQDWVSTSAIPQPPLTTSFIPSVRT